MVTWSDFLDFADGVHSVKVRAAVQDMRVRLRRFPDLPEAQELRTRAAALS
ncbi:hypothetical protein KMT30_09280 [Streptomyces sp. IBSBF 2953]|nr:hypothetical protein [Streptomyces hayashii]